MAAATPDDRAAGLKHVPAIAGAPWGRCPVGEATCGEPGRRRRVRGAGSPATSQVTMLKGMVGACDAMQGLFRTIGKIAKSDAPALIATTSSPVIRRSLPGATSIPFCASILSAIARSSRACASCIVLACGFIPDRNVWLDLLLSDHPAKQRCCPVCGVTYQPARLQIALVFNAVNHRLR